MRQSQSPEYDPYYIDFDDPLTFLTAMRMTFVGGFCEISSELLDSVPLMPFHLAQLSGQICLIYDQIHVKLKLAEV